MNRYTVSFFTKLQLIYIGTYIIGNIGIGDKNGS